jgi:hypothetical protein
MLFGEIPFMITNLKTIQIIDLQDFIKMVSLLDKVNMPDIKRR